MIVFYGLQLVQFLLKQAGVDKRTGDLYGNRDFLNIARNMARGLKVCSGKLYFLIGCFVLDAYGSLLDLYPRGLKMSTHNTSLFSFKPWKALLRDGCEMWTIHMLEIIFNRGGLLLYQPRTFFLKGKFGMLCGFTICHVVAIV